MQGGSDRRGETAQAQEAEESLAKEEAKALIALANFKTSGESYRDRVEQAGERKPTPPGRAGAVLERPSASIFNGDSVPSGSSSGKRRRLARVPKLAGPPMVTGGHFGGYAGTLTGNCKEVRNVDVGIEEEGRAAGDGSGDGKVIEVKGEGEETEKEARIKDLESNEQNETVWLLLSMANGVDRADADSAGAGNDSTLDPQKLLLHLQSSAPAQEEEETSDADENVGASGCDCSSGEVCRCPHVLVRACGPQV